MTAVLAPIQFQNSDSKFTSKRFKATPAFRRSFKQLLMLLLRLRKKQVFSIFVDEINKAQSDVSDEELEDVAGGGWGRYVA